MLCVMLFRCTDHDRNYDTAIMRLCVAATDNWRGIAPSVEGVDFNPEPPIFTAKFAKCQNHEHMLAIANEDGKVRRRNEMPPVLNAKEFLIFPIGQITLQNTNLTSHGPESERFLDGQQCHFNAVFDLEWMPGHMKFISASGDHTARLWDVRPDGFDEVRIFNGHTRSVKTAAFRKTDSAVFATGGRDGAILIWDTRAALNVGVMPRADNCIYSGHSGGPGTPMSSCKRRSARHLTPKLQANVSSSSITGLVFQDDTTLVSCGAGDGIIKVWDLRRNYTSYKKEPLPKQSIPYPGTSTFKGYTNLMVDEAGLRLYVNCMDNNVYAFNLGSYAATPLMRYTGLRNSTFYIKSSLSPDGQYLLSGSSDERAYIWNVRQSEPLVALVGHTVEVTCVAWSRAHDMRVVTCSDDARHKIWRIGPETIEADDFQTHYRGKAKVCEEYWKQARDARVHKAGKPRSAEGNGLKRRLCTLENTPRSVRRLMTENETTPSSAERAAMKRSFAEMSAENAEAQSAADEAEYEALNGGDAKRQHTESRGRRLFSTMGNVNATLSTSTGAVPSESCSSVFNGGPRTIHTSNLASILEEADSPTVATFVSSLTTTPTSTPLTSTGHRSGAFEQTPPTTTHTSAGYVTSSFFKPITTTKQLFVSPPFTERPHSFNSLKSPETPPNGCSSAAVNPSASTVLTASAAHTFTSPYQYSAVAAGRLSGLAVASTSAAIFSPTSNLPNYVINGEAPHLQLQSPKRKLKENVDWLTKIRKQKLLSTINAQLNEKLTTENNNSGAAAADGLGGTVALAATGADCPARCASPRMSMLKADATTAPASHSNSNGSATNAIAAASHQRAASPSSSSAHTPRRRTSRSGSDAANKTPSSSRTSRNPEHTLLRFFTRKTTPLSAAQQQQQQPQQSKSSPPSPQRPSMHID